jgi:hypothetical protein
VIESTANDNALRSYSIVSYFLLEHSTTGVLLSTFVGDHIDYSITTAHSSEVNRQANTHEKTSHHRGHPEVSKNLLHSCNQRNL